MLVLVPARLVAEVGRPLGRRAQVVGVAALSLVAWTALASLPEPRLEVRLVAAALVACALALAYVDARNLVIPDLYSAAFALAGLVGPLRTPALMALAGALVGGGLLWAVLWAWRRTTGAEGLGFGDVKLAAALGCLLGPEGVLQAIAAASIAGVAVGLALRQGGSVRLPLGSFLAPAGLAMLAWERWA